MINNNNILIINNLGSLMKKQFDSGNLEKIHPDFPKNIKTIQYFENGYSFLNNGPDNSILETVEKISNKIMNFEFDGAIISAGAYSCLIANYILNHLKKEVFVIGGDLPFYFGIITNRKKYKFNKNVENYLINVPQEMKPLNHEKIENSCYW
jgi:hypothetical protein